ncbi:serine/threonine-protein kinase [Pseudonocardia endophytica]|uniref:non-specific serine/threonine protein kinase n=1 Tax=Pseudonocardia endophytica TaxID=401976 RepID=A0A4R1HN67_PSEEN|nr:serine/threonine-protein kinase [Pseudonocardia endophytica]TCK22523.1 YVTN family beta-propeller protein [Pseudonocardia endophytica]
MGDATISPPSAQETFGPYRLEALVGRGGMGEVWRAYDTRRKRTVALKRLAAGQSDRPEFRARFRRESELAARLAAPNVIPIHDFGEIDGRLYLDMRLVDGRDIAAVLAADGPLPPSRTASVVTQLAAALDSAHAAGLVHRDVKPSNALLTDGDFVYLVDFGIAKPLEDATVVTTGGLVGTLGYMAPERLRGAGDDPRGDVYSLACLLHECLTGERPFPRTTAAAVAAAHLHDPVPRPSDVDRRLAVVDPVLARGMAKDPDERYATAGELARAVTAALARIPAAGDAEPARPDPGSTHPAEASPEPTRPLGGTAPGATLRHPAARRPDGTRADPGRTAHEQAPGAPSSLDPGPDGPAVGSPPRGGRRMLIGGVAAAVVVLVAAVAVPLLGRADDPTPSVPVPGFGTGPTTSPTVPAPDRIPVPVAEATVPGRPSTVVVIGDGRAHVVTARTPGVDDLVTIDTRTGDPIGEPVDVTAAGGGLAASPDGRTLYVPRCRASLCALDLVDVASGTSTAGIRVGEIPTTVVVSADGTRAYVLVWRRSAGVVESEVVVVDLRTRTTVGQPIPVASSGIGGLALSGDGARLVVADARVGSLQVVDTARRAPVGRAIPVGTGATDVAVNPAGDRAYVTDAVGGTLSVVDLTAGASAGPPIRTGDGAGAVTLSPDGNRAYVANRFEGTLSVVDLPASRVVGDPVPVGPEPVDVTATATRVAVLGATGTLRVLG